MADKVGGLPPLVYELFKLLPPHGPANVWPAAERAAFMKAAAAIFDVVYGRADQINFIEVGRDPDGQEVGHKG